jgi:hypothetical protein
MGPVHGAAKGGIMAASDGYGRFAAALGFGRSATLRWLLEAMLTEEEAAWAAALPASPGQLAERLGTTAEYARATLERLADRGIAYPAEETPTGRAYYHPDLGALADMVLIDPQYERLGAAFYDAWSHIFNHELIDGAGATDAAEAAAGPAPLPAFRVLPAEAALPAEGVADYDRASWIVEQAGLVAVTHCPCRRRERRCDHEQEVCLWLDDVARFAIRRGAARAISKAEALDILERSSANGLVHNTENREVPRVLCNCCGCCCAFLRPVTAYGLPLSVAVARFRAGIDPALCRECGLCRERCIFGARAQTAGGGAGAAARGTGGGGCAVAGPQGAIRLEPVPEATPLRVEKWLGEIRL